MTRNRQQLSRATIDENRVEISQLGRARTCRIRLTRLAGSSTTRTEMPNYWEDPEATASSPIPIAPIRPSKRSRRSRPPREERDISTTLISPNFGEPLSLDRSISNCGRRSSMIRPRFSFHALREKIYLARETNRSFEKLVYLFSSSFGYNTREEEGVWESVTLS